MGNIVLSNSGIGSLQTCPFMYYLKNIEDWEMIEKPIYYAVGGAFHTGKELIRKEMPLPEAIAEATKVFDDDIDSRALVAAMLSEWYKASRQFYQDYEIVDVEMKIELPLAEYEGGEIYFAGMADALLKDKNGRLFVGESKTTSDSVDRFCSKLWAQRQGLLYVWALRRLGYDVVGIIYDVTKKATIKRGMATPMEKRKYKKDGETLYAGQREHDESYSEYLSRLKQWYQSKPESFAQEVIVHSKQQLDAIENDMSNILKALVFYQATDNWPRSLSSCYAYNRACEFAHYCSAGNDELILQSLYKKRDRVFSKLINKGETDEFNTN